VLLPQSDVAHWQPGMPVVGFVNAGSSDAPLCLRALPGHPEPAVSWPSGFRGGAHARPQATPVHRAARRRGGGVAARGARAVGGERAQGRYSVAWRLFPSFASP
jgi:hypothetical protein